MPNIIFGRRRQQLNEENAAAFQFNSPFFERKRV